MTLASAFETARAFGFGGLVGAGVAGIIYVRYYKEFSYIGFYEFIGIGAALGLVFQETIQRIVGAIFRFPFNYLNFRRKLNEIDGLRREGKITPLKAEELIHELCKKRFLDKCILQTSILTQVTTFLRNPNQSITD